MGSDRIVDLVERFLRQRATRKPSPHTLAAYRRDLVGIAEVALDSVPDRASVDELLLADLTVDVLTDAFAAWASVHSAASVRRAHAAWNGFYRWLVASGRLDGNPMGAIALPGRPDTGKIRAIGHDDLARALRVSREPYERARHPWPERDHALLVVLATTGIRLSELTGLRLGSITGEPGAWQLTVTGKGSKTRTIPLAEPVRARIDAYLASRRERFGDQGLGDPATPLFVHHDGRPMTNRQVQYQVEQVFRRAGVTVRHGGALVHALRHTFATEALQGGAANIRELQALLGHRSLETTQLYLHAVPDELRAAITAHPATRLVDD